MTQGDSKSVIQNVSGGSVADIQIPSGEQWKVRSGGGRATSLEFSVGGNRFSYATSPNLDSADGLIPRVDGAGAYSIDPVYVDDTFTLKLRNSENFSLASHIDAIEV